MVFWMIILFVAFLCFVMGIIAKSGKVEQNTTRKSVVPGSINYSVKGTIYREKDEILAAQLSEVGDILVLRQEPTNTVDKNAIKVLTQTGKFIGYVDKGNASNINKYFNHISKSVITNKSNHEVPYIDAETFFSKDKCLQPDIITESSQMTTRQLMVEDVTKLSEAGFVERSATIVNNNELSLESIQALRNCDAITPLRLVKDYSNPKRKYAIKVYNDKDILLGWVEFFSAFRIYDHLDDVKSVRLEKRGSHFIVYMMPKGLDGKYPTDEEILLNQAYNSTLYPEITEAYKMRTSNPDGALSILLPIIDKEKGCRSMSICCTCYRALKRPTDELAMIERILDKTKKLQADEEVLYGRKLNPGEYEKWLRRKEIVEKMIK